MQVPDLPPNHLANLAAKMKARTQQVVPTEAQQQLVAQDEKQQAAEGYQPSEPTQAPAAKVALVGRGFGKRLAAAVAVAAAVPTTARAEAQVLPGTALGSLVAVAQCNPWNKPYGGKLVATHDAGALGQVVISQLQQHGVTAVVLAGGAIPGPLLGAVHVLSEAELEKAERNLPPDLVARLAWLKANPTEATTKAVPAQAPAATLPGHSKKQAKLGRKVATKQTVRRLLANDMLRQQQGRLEPYQGTEPRPMQRPEDMEAEGGLVPHLYPRAHRGPGPWL